MSNLPKDWELKRIGSFAIIVTGNTPPTKDIENFGNEYPWITPTDIKSSKDIFSSERKLSEKGYSISRQLPKNTVLITSIASIGKNAILRENGSCNQQINAILPSENHNTDFIYYWFEKNTDYIKSLAGQTAVPILNKKDFSNIIIPLPPLEEQKKIADILSTVDKKIAFVEENINATEELKKGLMQKLLTEGIGHTEFKDSELGRIPESWEILTLNNIISLLTDYHANGSYEKLKENVELLEKENYAVMIRTTNFENNDFKNNLIYITEHAYDYLKKSKVNENDIVINKIANAGATYIMPKMSKPVSLAMNLFLLKLINTVDNKFVYLQIKKREENLKALASGTSTKTITKNDVKNFVIALAPIEEQKQIAEILSTVDKKLENLKEKKQSFEELKKGLMKKLLTGDVRV